VAENLGGVVGYAVIGAVSGTLQMVLLRSYLPKAIAWLPGTSLGLALAYLAADFIGRAAVRADISMTEAASSLLFFVSLGTVFGLLTGGILIWIVRQPLSGVRS
jgi:hypothetical protein